MIFINPADLQPEACFCKGAKKNVQARMRPDVCYTTHVFSANQNRSLRRSKKLLSSLEGFGLKLSLFLSDSIISLSSLLSFFGTHTMIFT